MKQEKKNKDMTCANKNPTKFYYKKKTKQNNNNKKMYPKLLLNKLKVMKNPTFIYTHWTPSSKKFFKKLSIYMWPMRIHVWIMSESKFN